MIKTHQYHRSLFLYFYANITFKVLLDNSWSRAIFIVTFCFLIISFLSQCGVADDLCTDYFNKSVRMSTYLVAFVVCDFKSIESQTPKGIKVSLNQKLTLWLSSLVNAYFLECCI